MIKIFKITILFFFITLSFSGVSQSLQKHKYKNLSPKEFYVFLSAYNNSVLIDVNTKKEYKKSHILNSHLASNSTQLYAITDTLDFEQAVFVYCEYGDRSKQACKLLINKGFLHIFNLKDGLVEWKKSGYKVEKKK